MTVFLNILYCIFPFFCWVNTKLTLCFLQIKLAHSRELTCCEALLLISEVQQSVRRFRQRKERWSLMAASQGFLLLDSYSVAYSNRQECQVSFCRAVSLRGERLHYRTSAFNIPKEMCSLCDLLQGTMPHKPTFCNYLQNI